MSDYIDREAAKKAVVEATGNGHSPFNAIVMLPAADVRPVKRGKWLDLWIEDDELIGGGYTVPQCSECNEDSYGTTPFCPFCGADMRGETDGT